MTMIAIKTFYPVRILGRHDLGPGLDLGLGYPPGWCAWSWWSLFALVVGVSYVAWRRGLGVAVHRDEVRGVASEVDIDARTPTGLFIIGSE